MPMPITTPTSTTVASITDRPGGPSACAPAPLPAPAALGLGRKERGKGGIEVSRGSPAHGRAACQAFILTIG